jgi:hypothetical protein
MNSRVLAVKVVSGPGRGVGIVTIHAARRIGQTNPLFSPPAGLDSSSMGSVLSTALNNLLSSFSSNGVPSEHAYSAVTAAFQTAWNGDPIVSAAAGNALLHTDGGYGPNTALAVATVNGGSAPTVNTAPAPPGAPPATPVPAPSSNNASALAGMSTWGLWLVGAAAVGGAYLVGKSAMDKHGGKVAHHARRAHAALRHHARRLVRRRH